MRMRKTYDVYEVQLRMEEGWKCVTTELDASEAESSKAFYELDTSYRVRVIKKRVKKAAIDLLKEVVECEGWWVGDCNFSGGGKGWELGKYTPFGEDFFFAIEHDSNAIKAIEEIANYYESFDTDEHVRELVIAKENGLQGVPSVEHLLQDAKYLKVMLRKLTERTKKYEQQIL